MPGRARKSTSGSALDISGAFASLRDWHCLVILAALAAVFFRNIILGQAYLWEDFIYQFYPFRNFATVALSRGEIPLWNPYTLGGMPFLADITSTVLYLPNILLVPFVSGGRLNFWFVEMFIVAHVVLAGVAMFYLARSLALSRIAATFSGFVYMLSGFTIVHMIHLVMICQVAWFPLAVLLFRRGLLERSMPMMILCGFVLSMITCGGHIQITLYFFVFLLIIYLVELVHEVSTQKKEGRGLRAGRLLHLSVLAAAAVAIAVGLSAVQLLPTSELTDLSVREQFTFARTTEGELWWQQLITLLIPKFFGTANHLGGANPLPYWGPQAYWSFWETILYTGIAALILALFALKSVRSDRMLALVAIFAGVAILVGLGDNFILHRLFFEFVPGFGRFRSLGRWGFFIMFAVSILGGFGLQTLLRSDDRRKDFSRVLVAVTGVTLFVTIALQLHLLDGFILWQVRQGAGGLGPVREAVAAAQDVASSQSIVSSGVVLLSAGALLLLERRKVAPALAVAAVFGVQFIDMSIFGYEQNNGTINPEEYFNQRQELIAGFREESKEGLFRINMRNGSAMLLDRNQGMIDDIFLMEGYTQLALLRRAPPAATPDKGYELMNTKYRLRVDTVVAQGRRALQMRLAVDSACLPRAFLVYRAEVFATAAQESLYLAADQFDPRRSVALEERPENEPRAAAPESSRTVSISEYGDNAIVLDVSTPRAGYLVLSEIYYPGWNAYVDGKKVPVYRADWCLRALVVDAGRHRVEMKFESPSFREGADISLFTFGLCVVGFIVSARRKRSSPPAAAGRNVPQR